MAVVYRARDLRMDRLVALKVLHERATPERLARLRREGQLTANLQHPGIVRIHSAGDLDGQPWLAYEVVEGARTLDQAMEGLGLRERVCLVREVAAAIGHAHEHGVIHRDIKAENVLVDLSGRARVIDFGIAYQDQAETLSKSGGLLGTPFAMAPEQFGRGRVGPPADVWALGVLLYEALTDEQPFEGESLLQLAAQVEEAKVTPPTQLRQEVPRELSAICLGCLQRQPADRYPDAGSLAQDLESWLEGRAISGTASQVGPGLRLARRGAPGLLLAAVLIGGVALAWVLLSGGDVNLQAQALLERGGTAKGRAAIVALLESEAAEDLSPLSRGLLNLSLAEAPTPDEGSWRACLEHARAAQDVSELRARARRREAQCWLALELPQRAEAILEELTPELSSDGSFWLELAECQVETGRPRRALVALEKARGSDRREVWVTRARALVASGARDQVAQELNRTRGPEALLVRSEWAWGHDDVESILRTGVSSYPNSLPLRRALARHLLRVDAPKQAAECLGDLSECQPEAEFLRALTEQPSSATLSRLAERTQGWRRPAMRYFLRGANRHLGTRDRARGLKGAERFSGYARIALERARGLGQEPFPELAQVEELQRRLDAGPLARDEVARAAARAEFERVREAQKRRDRTAAGLERAYKGILEIDPSFEEARYMALAAERLAQGSQLQEISPLLDCVRREPRLSTNLHADLQRALWTERFRGGGERGPAKEPLAAAYLIVLRLEATGEDAGNTGRALGLLDGVLARDSDHPLALALRGFVLLRLMREERAGLDLDRARRMAPGCGVSAFYRFLLWAKLGRNKRHLLRELNYADGQAFHTWNMRWWNPASSYPELGPYLEDPAFALVKGKHNAGPK
jgi:tetratricopeptide (TPR) repeat protein